MTTLATAPIPVNDLYDPAAHEPTQAEQEWWAGYERGTAGIQADPRNHASTHWWAGWSTGYNASARQRLAAIEEEARGVLAGHPAHYEADDAL